MNGNTYGYDCNGNQTTRIIGSDTFTLLYDAENRLVEVKKNTVTMANFVYDGDGRRVKSVVSGETIYFAGAHYEFNDTTDEVTKYYTSAPLSAGFAGASAIAVRKYIIPQSQTLHYLLGDHLGSTSVSVNAATGETVETRYKPWGEVRYTTPSKTLPTRYTFTGQYSHIADEATDLGSGGFGLMFFQSRFYDPALGRFTSADTIIPQHQGVQAWDRFAFVNNNPVRYVDPSGHVACQTQEDCEDMGTTPNGGGSLGGGNSSGNGGNCTPGDLACQLANGDYEPKSEDGIYEDIESVLEFFGDNITSWIEPAWNYLTHPYGGGFGQVFDPYCGGCGPQIDFRITMISLALQVAKGLAESWKNTPTQPLFPTPQASFTPVPTATVTPSATTTPNYTATATTTVTPSATPGPTIIPTLTWTPSVTPTWHYITPTYPLP